MSTVAILILYVSLIANLLLIAYCVYLNGRVKAARRIMQRDADLIVSQAQAIRSAQKSHGIMNVSLLELRDKIRDLANELVTLKKKI